MEKKKLFKSQMQMIIYVLIFIICIVLFIVIGQIDFKKNITTDPERFSDIYKVVDKDNLYLFADATDVLNILNGNSGIILMGFPTNKWTGHYANILNDACKDLNVKEILYYDFFQDRSESNGTYETIVNKLKVYAPVNDEGYMDIQAPTVLIVKKGEVIAYFDDTSVNKGSVTPEIYYTDNQIARTYENFYAALLNYFE